jgi:hypothetical protein
VAVQTAPTLRTIVMEALRRANPGVEPDKSDIQRAEREWMPEIKSDIVRRETKLKSLYVTSTAIIKEGLSRYANPDDYGSDLTLVLLNGSTTGTAQAGSASSITLASDEDLTEANALGKEIIVTSGTGKGSLSQITSYSTTTLVAGVEPDFESAPGASSGYMVVDDYRALNKKTIRLLDRQTQQTASGKPIDYHPTTNKSVDEFTLRPVPDATYGLKMRYYADLLTLDLTSALMLRLYRKWKNVFVQGIYYKKLSDLDDDRKNTERSLYFSMLLELLMDETKDLGEDVLEIKPYIPNLSTRQ